MTFKELNKLDISEFDKLYLIEIFEQKGVLDDMGDWASDHSSLRKFLNLYGFVKKEWGNKDHVYANESLGKEGLVIKWSYFAGRKPRRSVPTVRILGSWVIQPIVKTNKKSIERAFKDIQEGYNFGDDAHSGNIGVYRGKAVAFDW